MNKSYQYPLANKPPHRRRRSNPNFVYIAAGILVLGGIVLLVVWLSGPNKPLNTLFATDTPTPTITFTPSLTPLPSDTPTITSTPTETATLTPSAPFQYTVQEGDSLFSIAQKYGLGENGIKLILVLNPYATPASRGGQTIGIDPHSSTVIPGQIIWVPNPGMPLPTATPIPVNIPRGSKIEYTVESGDTLAVIASKFNSTEDAISKENNLQDPNAIFVGQLLVIPVNLVTPTATRPPTSTPATPVTPTVTGTP
jgi:LysM repeat protein